MSRTGCKLGRKTCQWPWGRTVCTEHAELMLEALRIATTLSHDGPIEVSPGRFVSVVAIDWQGPPSLRLVE